MTNKKYLAFMVLLVFSAGCITGGGERKPTIDQNNGIIISSFTAEPLPAKSGDTVSFFADIENVGGTTARNVLVSLYGIENVWKNRDGSAVGTTPTVSYPDMKPPSLSDNRAGDFKIASFYHMPTDLPEGVTTRFPVIARVTFDYHSTGTITIPANSNTLYTAKRNKGEAIDIQPRIDNTHAPVQIRITKATVPLIIEETRQNDEIATFLFEFVDVGSGSPVTDNTIGRMGGTLTVDGPGVSFSDCLGVASGNRIDITGNQLDLVKLRSDRRVPFGCSIRIRRGAWTATMSGNIIFKIDMNYKYFVEKTVEVPVTGTGARDPLASTTTSSSSSTSTTSSTTTTTTSGGTTTTVSGSRAICIYDQSGVACAGTNPHCDNAGNCNIGGCGYNPNKFNYDPNSGSYSCSSNGFTVCTYDDVIITDPTCAGTNPHCTNTDGSNCVAGGAVAGGCGYNPHRFIYDPHSGNYACS